MKKKLFYVFVALAMMVGFLPAGVPTSVKASPTTIYVPDNYATIQAAVNAASPGMTIMVRDGTYTENVDVNKAVTIQSVNGANATIVQAYYPNDHIFDVTSDNVTISGFNIMGAIGQEKAGIYLGNGVKQGIIVNNHISGNNRGIILYYSSNNTISANDISSVTSASGYLGTGIVLDNANGNVIRKNAIKSNTYYGVKLYFATYNRIEGNDISNNYGGIYMDRGQYNTVTGNNIANITTFWGYGISMQGANNYGNTIYLNDFANRYNTSMVAPDSNNIWSFPETLPYRYGGIQHTNYLGNYWDNYTGTDANNDGIGDSPYAIGGNYANSDNYPLKATIQNYEIGAPAPTPPTVTTDNVTNITSNSARLNGTLTSLGSAASANVSFQ